MSFDTAIQNVMFGTDFDVDGVTSGSVFSELMWNKLDIASDIGVRIDS